MARDRKIVGHSALGTPIHSTQIFTEEGAWERRAPLQGEMHKAWLRYYREQGLSVDILDCLQKVKATTICEDSIYVTPIGEETKTASMQTESIWNFIRQGDAYAELVREAYEDFWDPQVRGRFVETVGYVPSQDELDGWRKERDEVTKLCTEQLKIAEDSDAYLNSLDEPRHYTDSRLDDLGTPDETSIEENVKYADEKLFEMKTRMDYMMIKEIARQDVLQYSQTNAKKRGLEKLVTSGKTNVWKSVSPIEG